MKEFEKLSFSDITNKMKKNNSTTKHIMLIIPMIISLFLKERIDTNKDTNKNNVKPKEEPTS